MPQHPPPPHANQQMPQQHQQSHPPPPPNSNYAPAPTTASAKYGRQHDQAPGYTHVKSFASERRAQKAKDLADIAKTLKLSQRLAVNQDASGEKKSATDQVKPTVQVSGAINVRGPAAVVIPNLVNAAATTITPSQHLQLGVVGGAGGVGGAHLVGVGGAGSSGLGLGVGVGYSHLASTATPLHLSAAQLAEFTKQQQELRSQYVLQQANLLKRQQEELIRQTALQQAYGRPAEIPELPNIPIVEPKGMRKNHEMYKTDTGSSKWGDK